jgi:hypothetical protein
MEEDGIPGDVLHRGLRLARGARFFVPVAARGTAGHHVLVRDLSSVHHSCSHSPPSATQRDLSAWSYLARAHARCGLPRRLPCSTPSTESRSGSRPSTPRASHRRSSTLPTRPTWSILPVRPDQCFPAAMRVSMIAARTLAAGPCAHPGVFHRFIGEHDYTPCGCGLAGCGEDALQGDGGIVVNSICPGWVRTEMDRPTAPRSVEQGANTAVCLATDAPLALTGTFFRDRQEMPC